MKPIFKVSLLAATVLLAVGCQKEETEAPKTDAPATEVVAKTDAKATDTAKSEESSSAQFKTEDDKAAYAIGLSFAQYLNQSMAKQSEIGLSLDQDLILEGIQDAFAETPKLDEKETEATLKGLDERVSTKLEAKAKEDAAKAKVEAEKNLKTGEDFRAKFEKEEGVTKTDSGLLYKVITPAKDENAASPKSTDTVVVHYKGTLIDGTEFDSSYKRNEPATFPLDRVIPGWTEGVQLMKVGEKAELVIPPELAYGDQASPSIPGNSTLVFEVELKEIKDPAEVKAQAAKQPSQAEIQAAIEAAQAQQQH